MKNLLLLIALSLSFSMPMLASGDAPVAAAAVADATTDLIGDLRVYPNPTSNGYVTIEFDNMERANLTVRIYNMIGNEVYNEAVSAGDSEYSQRLYLGELPKGVYVLEVSDGSRKQTKRISYI